jgi:hypothetical protein
MVSSEVMVPTISAIIAAIGLFFTGYELHRSSTTRQFEVVESVFKDIRKLEQELYDKYRDADKQKISEWDFLFFNQLEWFAFLGREF